MKKIITHPHFPKQSSVKRSSIFSPSELVAAEERLRLADEELLRMEDEGGTPLNTDLELQAHASLIASNRIKEVLMAIEG